MKINRNVIIGKAGGTSGKHTVNYKISIPVAMIYALGITKEDRSVNLELVDNQIIIKKANKE